MVEWAVSKTGLRALDGTVDITFDAPEWHDEGSSDPTNHGPANALAGSALGISTTGPITLTTEAGEYVTVEANSTVDLPADTYELAVAAIRCDGASRATGSDPGDRSGAAKRVAGTRIRFAGPVRVRVDDGAMLVSFPERTPIAIEFGDSQPDPIVVPKTTEGIATAITHASSALRTTGPDRSHPAFRSQPPRIEFGDREIPHEIRATTPETGLRLRVPDSIEATLVAAPLAYYIGASVEVDGGTTPMLEGPEFERELGPLPELQHEVAALLRRVFLLDTLSRAVEPSEVTPAGGVALDRLGLDPEALSEASPAERLRRYCAVPATRLDPELPEWHLSTYVEPVIENARSLPYLLSDLSLVYLPSASALDGKGLLRRSLDDFYRAGEVASVDRLEPNLHAGRAHGWLAPGTPIDVFKTSRSAYEHRRAYGDHDPPLDVTVVFNDEAMAGEHDRVASIYREHAANLPMNVTVATGLTKRELAAVFAEANDFVHFIGHCDINGLRCPDGSFPTRSLDTCRTRTFFLNACGSYHEGFGLVEAGSVAGAVTLTAVLNDQAATVGTTFARLLTNGFDIERAISLARRRIMMGKDYAVVGDGTHALAGALYDPPAVALLDRRGDSYHLTYEVVGTGTTGGTYRPPWGADNRTYPHGVNADIECSRQELLACLEAVPMPVIYDGDFHWSSDLARRL